MLAAGWLLQYAMTSWPHSKGRNIVAAHKKQSYSSRGVTLTLNTLRTSAVIPYQCHCSGKLISNFCTPSRCNRTWGIRLVDSNCNFYLRNFSRPSQGVYRIRKSRIEKRTRSRQVRYTWRAGELLYCCACCRTWLFRLMTACPTADVIGLVAAHQITHSSRNAHMPASDHYCGFDVCAPFKVQTT